MIPSLPEFYFVYLLYLQFGAWRRSVIFKCIVLGYTLMNE